MRKRLLIALGATGAAIGAYALLLRPWHLRWGATDDEVQRALPGDELVAHPKVNATHAITIHAPVEDVWAWLVQIGQGRGGFYSYAWLENLVGCHMRNASRIHPEWQHLQEGDAILLHPKAPPVPVNYIDPGRVLVLGASWCFYLYPLTATTTRLIVRNRGDYAPQHQNPFVNFILWRVLFEPAHFIMERKMLRGLQQRAEAVSSHAKAVSEPTRANA
jgi:hypothetical protein